MELLDLYNNRKEKLNKTWDRNSGETRPGEYKLSVHMWLMNSKNELLIQKRVATKNTHPNKWAFTGGAVDAGESSYEGAKREIQEELGLTINDLDLLISFRREHDFVDVWVAKIDVAIEDLKLLEEEVSEAKWASLEEIEKLMQEDKFVPALNLYYDLFKKLLYKNYINK